MRQRGAPGGNDDAREVWRDRVSFGITLVAVAAFAIFVGWLMGQYLIRYLAQTPPRPAVTQIDAAQVGRELQREASQQAQQGSGAQASAPAPQPAASPPQGAPAGQWRVQVGAFREPARAESLARELRATGYDARVVSGDWHRVYAGDFQEEAGARSLAQELREKGYEAYPTSR